MNINYEYYKIFYHVAKCGSFLKASEELMNNQPNITRVIKNLENQLGCVLFIRSNKGVRLTQEGEKLYNHIEIAVQQIGLGEKQIIFRAELFQSEQAKLHFDASCYPS